MLSEHWEAMCDSKRWTALRELGVRVTSSSLRTATTTTATDWREFYHRFLYPGGLRCLRPTHYPINGRRRIGFPILNGDLFNLRLVVEDQ